MVLSKDLIVPRQGLWGMCEVVIKNGRIDRQSIMMLGSLDTINMNMRENKGYIIKSADSLSDFPSKVQECEASNGNKSQSAALEGAHSCKHL